MKVIVAAFLVCTSSLASAQGSPVVQFGREEKLESKILGETRTLWIRTPPGYEKGSERYPVLYMTDGDAHFAHTSSTIEFLARQERMPELILVGVLNTDRARDLTPTPGTLPRPGGPPMEFPTAGGALRFLEFFEDELIPHIEQDYRTVPFRIFAGHSFGGLFALTALTQKPELFQAVLAVSPTLGWNDGWPVKQLGKLFEARPELHGSLFVTLGDEGDEMQAGWDALQSLVARGLPKGFAFVSERMLDENHGSIVLRAHYLGLRWVFRDWALPRDPNTGGVAGGWKAAQEHYQRIAKTYGMTREVPEATANAIGYQLLGEGDAQAAIEVFTWNTEHYPRSANVYDSLGEAYERSGELDLARANYAKAVEIARAAQDPLLGTFDANYKRALEAAAVK